MKFISLKHYFKAYQYFDNHFVIKNIFTDDICNWLYSYNKIETNNFLLFSILHMLDLVNINYNIHNDCIKYNIQDIKLIVNNYTKSWYSSFLYNCDFKLIIPLSNCTMTLDTVYDIIVNKGEVVVLPGNRDFMLDDKIKFISIDITGSLDVDAMVKHGGEWWIKDLPVKDHTCLTYIDTPKNI